MGGAKETAGDGELKEVAQFYTCSYTSKCVILIDMATNLAIKDGLIEQARQAGKHKTKKEAVTAALEEYIRHRQQLRFLELMGTIDYWPDYDYKRGRRRKRP